MPMLYVYLVLMNGFVWFDKLNECFMTNVESNDDMECVLKILLFWECLRNYVANVCIYVWKPYLLPLSYTLIHSLSCRTHLALTTFLICFLFRLSSCPYNIYWSVLRVNTIHQICTEPERYMSLRTGNVNKSEGGWRHPDVEDEIRRQYQR